MEVYTDERNFLESFHTKVYLQEEQKSMKLINEVDKNVNNSESITVKSVINSYMDIQDNVFPVQCLQLQEEVRMWIVDYLFIIWSCLNDTEGGAHEEAVVLGFMTDIEGFEGPSFQEMMQKQKLNIKKFLSQDLINNIDWNFAPRDTGILDSYSFCS